MSVISFNNYISTQFLFKGIILARGTEIRRSLFSFSTVTKEWIKLVDLPSNRTKHNAIVINNNMFIVGGGNNENIDKYDASTKTFVTVKRMETKISEFGICRYDDETLL